MKNKIMGWGHAMDPGKDVFLHLRSAAFTKHEYACEN
jgi:hypothetical protein